MGDRNGVIARLKKNAKRQRDIRAQRDRDGQCRTCGAPATHSKRTGKLARQCSTHLDCDIRRKDIYILPASETEYPLEWAPPDGRKNRRQYPLPWFEPEKS